MTSTSTSTPTNIHIPTGLNQSCPEVQNRRSTSKNIKSMVRKLEEKVIKLDKYVTTLLLEIEVLVKRLEESDAKYRSISKLCKHNNQTPCSRKHIRHSAISKLTFSPIVSEQLVSPETPLDYATPLQEIQDEEENSTTTESFNMTSN
ncbi:hypothetical protein O0L34_g19215 [Tuta absoluta]|nr:hypothetical protein O0L34_g19215 [Tuta absoluta]